MSVSPANHDTPSWLSGVNTRFRVRESTVAKPRAAILIGRPLDGQSKSCSKSWTTIICYSVRAKSNNETSCSCGIKTLT